MKIKCPACSDILEVPDSAAGNVVNCPCGKKLRVPGGSAASHPDPAPQVPPAALGAVGGAAGGGFDQLTREDLQPDQQSNHPYTAELPGSNQFDPLQGYARPSGTGFATGRTIGSGAVRATLGQRIVGALVDSFLMLGMGILFGAGGAAVGGMIDSQDQDLIIGIGYLAFYVGIFATSILNAVLITISGQSVGKKVAGTRIVDRESGAQSGFLQGFLLRNFVFGLITSIPCIGALIGLIDLIMLFPEPNETLHDKLARTAIVQA